MKIIDEKGNLFGKVNIIDILIVLIILGGLIGVNYKLGLVKKLGAQSGTEQKAIVSLWVKGISPYTVDAIKEGDVVSELKSNNEIGTIIKKEIKPTKEPASDASGKWITSEVPGKSDVYITIETLSGPINDNLRLGSKDAKVGTTLDIKGPKFQVSSYIIGVD